MHYEFIIRAGIVVGFLWMVRRLAGTVRVAPMDILVALVLGTLAQAMLLGKVSLPEGFLAIGFLVWVHLLSIVIFQYSPRLRALACGPPLSLVRRERCCAARWRVPASVTRSCPCCCARPTLRG